MSLLVVVPFLNEERYLPALLDSIDAQTRPPDELLLVDDGSGDRSPEIAARFAEQHPYARVLRRPPRPAEADRLASAAEWLAFEWALEQRHENHDIIAKLDADLRLTPGVFSELEAHFEADPRLGLAGAFLIVREPDGTTSRPHCPPYHVAGATKFYRRECYQEIAPVPALLGWDTIDEVRARVRGWRTASFTIETGDPEHLRRTGSHDGVLRGFRRAGLAAYVYGAHPVHVLMAAAARARVRPVGLCSVNYLMGWTLAAAQRLPRAETEVRELVRAENRERMSDLLTPRPAPVARRRRSSRRPPG